MTEPQTVPISEIIELLDEILAELEKKIEYATENNL
jgi:hypothetical protein